MTYDVRYWLTEEEKEFLCNTVLFLQENEDILCKAFGYSKEIDEARVLLKRIVENNDE